MKKIATIKQQDDYGQNGYLFTLSLQPKDPYWLPKTEFLQEVETLRSMGYTISYI